MAAEAEVMGVGAWEALATPGVAAWAVEATGVVAMEAVTVGATAAAAVHWAA